MSYYKNQKTFHNVDCKEKAAEDYDQNGVLKENTNNRYRHLSEEQKEVKSKTRISKK